MTNEPETAIAVSTPTALARPADELSVEDLVSRVAKVHEVQAQVMREGVHYGAIPGVDKPTLLKPGAEMLGMVFRLDPEFSLEQIREGDHLTVVATCTLFHVPSGARLGSGVGTASTRESKYAWRKGERICPDCGSPAIIKGKVEYGGGFVCFGKKGGCGAKFGDGDPAILDQQVGRIPNPDIYDTHNTVLKMAVKRAHVAAILFVTCASEVFTQDAEDLSTAPSTGGPSSHGRMTLRDALSRIESCATSSDLEALAVELRTHPWKRSEAGQIRAAIEERRATFSEAE